MILPNREDEEKHILVAKELEEVVNEPITPTSLGEECQMESVENFSSEQNQMLVGEDLGDSSREIKDIAKENTKDVDDKTARLAEKSETKHLVKVGSSNFTEQGCDERDENDKSCQTIGKLYTKRDEPNQTTLQKKSPSVEGIVSNLQDTNPKRDLLGDNNLQDHQLLQVASLRNPKLGDALKDRMLENEGTRPVKHSHELEDFSCNLQDTNAGKILHGKTQITNECKALPHLIKYKCVKNTPETGVPIEADSANNHVKSDDKLISPQTIGTHLTTDTGDTDSSAEQNSLEATHETRSILLEQGTASPNPKRGISHLESTPLIPSEASNKTKNKCESTKIKDPIVDTAKANCDGCGCIVS